MKRLLASFALVSGLLIVATAQGGAKVTSSVRIDVFSWGTLVYGNPGDARASADSNQRIGCTIESAPGFVRGLCQATNSSNRTVSCYVTAPEMIQAIHSIGPATYIHFGFDAGASDCNRLTLENGSRYRPVTP